MERVAGFGRENLSTSISSFILEELGQSVDGALEIAEDIQVVEVIKNPDINIKEINDMINEINNEESNCDDILSESFISGTFDLSFEDLDTFATTIASSTPVKQPKSILIKKCDDEEKQPKQSNKRKRDLFFELGLSECSGDFKEENYEEEEKENPKKKRKTVQFDMTEKIFYF